MTEDTGESEICGTLGCENEPVADGYCAECADISPGILDTANESDADESADSVSYNPVEGSSYDGNPGFETEESVAYKQNHALVASRRALDQRGQRGGSR